MGTPAATIIKDDGEFIVAIQRTTDGYPAGHGRTLVDFLKGIELVKGLRGEKKNGSVANGMGCLAAQVIWHLKDHAGTIYILSQEEYESAPFEYEYIIEGSTLHPSKGITLTISDLADTLFKGHPKDCDIDAIEEKLQGEE